MQMLDIRVRPTHMAWSTRGVHTTDLLESEGIRYTQLSANPIMTG